MVVARVAGEISVESYRTGVGSRIARPTPRRAALLRCNISRCDGATATTRPDNCAAHRALKRFRLDIGSLPRAHYGHGATAVLTGRSAKLPYGCPQRHSCIGRRRGIGICHESGFDCCRTAPRGSERGHPGTRYRAHPTVPVGSHAHARDSGFDRSILAVAPQSAAAETQSNRSAQHQSNLKRAARTPKSSTSWQCSRNGAA